MVLLDERSRIQISMFHRYKAFSTDRSLWNQSQSPTTLVDRLPMSPSACKAHVTAFSYTLWEMLYSVFTPILLGRSISCSSPSAETFVVVPAWGQPSIVFLKPKGITGFSEELEVRLSLDARVSRLFQLRIEARERTLLITDSMPPPLLNSALYVGRQAAITEAHGSMTSHSRALTAVSVERPIITQLPSTEFTAVCTYDEGLAYLRRYLLCQALWWQTLV